MQIAKTFELHAVEYIYRGKEVPSYGALPEELENKLPYIAVTCLLTKNCKANVFALYDSGCSVSLISDSFANKFPNSLKETIEPLDISLGVAAQNAGTRVTGKVQLMIAMKSFQGDKYPLVFVHEFYIANRLNKEMYIGSDFILNSKIVIRTTNEGFDVHYPEQYTFSIDPNDNSQKNFLPLQAL